MMKAIVSKKIKTVFVLLIFCTAAAAQQQRAEILWDHYGVPHIYARSTPDLFYAFGYCQMSAHADLLLRIYGQARARASEYWGEDYVDNDKKMLLFRMPERARNMYQAQDRDFKSYFDAFVAGINAYAKAHPETISKEVKPVLPVTVFDVAAHILRVPCLEFLAGREIGTTLQFIEAGSNSVAVAPSRSASGNALLMIDPHLPWSGFTTWFEADLHAPGIHAYGVALAGMPMFGIAFNEHLGWTHTNNTIDAADVYELVVKNDSYELDSTLLPFEKTNTLIKVRQKNGSLKEEPVTLRYSRHGPVLGEKNGKAYSIRLTGLDNYFLFRQYHRMMMARNLKEFETALQLMQQPFFNVVYADREGNILYLFNGNVPRRTEGNWAFWRGTVTGGASKYIWTGIHPYQELPRVLNPGSGFVQNANDPPWTSTWPKLLDPQKFPPYMSPLYTDLRPQRALKMLLSDSAISFDELVSYKMDTGVEPAERLLDDLLAAVSLYPDSLTKEAAGVLHDWDRKTDSGSRGALLFFQWLRKLTPAQYAHPWNFSDPLNTPSGLKDQQKAVQQLAEAAKEVQQIYGVLDKPWGEVNRFRMGNQDLPGNGGEGGWGIYRVIRFVPDTDKKKRADFGDSYAAVVEFGKRIRAEACLSYGNASQKENRHLGDQLMLMSQKKLRPVFFYREEVEKNTERKERLMN